MLGQLEDRVEGLAEQQRRAHALVDADLAHLVGGHRHDGLDELQARARCGEHPHRPFDRVPRVKAGHHSLLGLVEDGVHDGGVLPEVVAGAQEFDGVRHLLGTQHVERMSGGHNDTPRIRHLL